MPELEISRIHDAYAADSECPICDVMTVAETTYVKSFHGGRVMAPEVRVDTNRTGFCPAHFERLYRGEGKLGLALLVHTHLAQIVPALRRDLEGAVVPQDTRPARLGPFSRKDGAVSALARSLSEVVARCYICDMLAADLDRYCFTVIYLWQKDPEFLDTLSRSRGFCLAHYAAILRKAERMLRAPDLRRWTELTVPLMTRSLERLEQQVHGFTQRYHHGTAVAGRGEEERTALSRAIQKLTGRALRLERGLEPGGAEDQDQDHLV